MSKNEPQNNNNDEELKEKKIEEEQEQASSPPISADDATNAIKADYILNRDEYKVTREPTGKPVKPQYTTERISEQTVASWYQWPLFSWVTPLLDRGTERTANDEPLKAEDMLRLPAHEDPTYNYQRIRLLWNDEMKKAEEDPEYKPNLVGVLWATYKHRVLTGTALRFLSDGAAFAVPFLLREYTRWLTDTSTEPWEGWLWMVGLVGGNMIMALSLQACMQHTLTAFNEMRNGLRLLIFDAVLRYPASNEEMGKVLAAHQQDTQALLELAVFVHGAVVGLPMVLGGAVALYFFIGFAGLAVFGIMVFTTPLQGIVMAKVFGLRGPFIKAGARRVNILSELLQGIRISKYMCWEDNFVSKIDEFRSEELIYYESMQRWRIPMMLVMMALPLIINFAAFALQVAIDGSIRVDTAFAALTLLNALRIPIMMVPMSISKILDTKIAMDRVAEVCAYRGFYDYAKRYDDDSDEAKKNADKAIVMRNVSVLGDKKKKKDGEKKKKESGSPASPASPASPSAPGSIPTGSSTEPTKEEEEDPTQIIASKLSLTIKRGALVACLGATASGKSVLVRALLGECDIRKDEPDHELCVYGSTCYIPQESWVMNATVRKNIVMNSEFDQEWYDKVCAKCQLLDDFKALPGGEKNCEIGEKGVSVSGGQKSRISIARAMYSRRSIVIADDPLSAVDPHVSNALFEDVFSNEGEMRERTRILVTHQVQLALSCDYVIMMKNNAIDFFGTYDEFRKSGAYDHATECEAAEQKEKAEARKKKLQEQGKLDDAEKKKKAAEAASSPTTTTALIESPGKDKEGSSSKIISEKEKEEQEQIEKGKLMVSEINSTGEIPWSIWWWYLKLGEVFTFIVVIFFALFAAGFFVLSNFTLAFWTDKTPIPGLGPWENEDYMLTMAVCAILGSFFLVIRQWVFVSFITKVAKKAHDSMMQRIVRAPVAFFDTVPLGRILTRFQKDIQSMDFMVSEQLQFAINQVFLVIGALITVFISAPYIMVLMPFLVMIFLYLYNKYSNTVRGLKRLDGSATGPVSAIVNEAVGGLASIRTYQIADKLYEEHESRTADSATPQMNIRSCQRWLATRSDLLGNIILLFVCLFGVISRQGDQSSWLPLTPSLIALAISSTIQATNAVTMLTRSLSELSTEMASTERINEFATALPQEPTYDYEEEGNLEAPGPSWPASTELVFENVSMRYRAGLPLVLKEVSFKLPGGKRLGVAGKTGSGKSSTLLTLFRIMELAEGSITLDGRDISKLEMHDTRKNLINIPQDPLLFSGTIRSNLDPFNEHSDEAIWAVLDRLKLRERLTTFITGKDDKKGLEAVVKERAANFSQGEKQTLCLARAILKKNAPGAGKSMIVTLDEATASVDDKTDALIQKTIREEFKSDPQNGRQFSTIVIAHRLSTIIDSDLILVLDAGRLKEFDSPINLLNKAENDEGAIFRGMCAKLGKTQFDILKKIAAGEMSYEESLKMDTDYENK